MVGESDAEHTQQNDFTASGQFHTMQVVHGLLDSLLSHIDAPLPGWSMARLEGL